MIVEYSDFIKKILYQLLILHSISMWLLAY